MNEEIKVNENGKISVRKNLFEEIKKEKKLIHLVLIATKPDIIKQAPLILELKKNYTVIIVTHNMQQAARISDYTGFMYLGKMVEFGETHQIFENPKEKLTENYITGRFG